MEKSKANARFRQRVQHIKEQIRNGTYSRNQGGWIMIGAYARIFGRPARRVRGARGALPTDRLACG